MIVIDSYNWDFGDGTSSTEANPTHTYVMAGIFTWILTVILSNGTVLTTTGIEYVYANNYDYETDDSGDPVLAGEGAYDPDEVVFTGLQVSRTDKCFRLAVPQKLEQGIGWAEYDDVYLGERTLDFPYPMGEVGTVKVRDSNEVFHNIAMDSRSFRFHEMGLDDQWKDGEDAYGGSEVESEILLKEHSPPIGASAKIQHDQTHSYVKPWYKDRRNTGEYNAEGFRPEFNEDVFIRENSEPTDFSITKVVPIKGQLVFDRKAESENLQIGFRLRGSPWRFVKTQTWFRQIDSAGSPSNKLMTEMSWALELSTPTIWLARNINPLLNSASGRNVDGGSFLGTTTGPDGMASGVVFGVADSYTINGITISGDFTWIGWLRSPTFPMTLFSVGNITVSLTHAGGNNRLTWNDGVNSFNIILQQAYGAWTMLAVIRSGNNVIVYEGYTLANTQLLAGIVNATGVFTHMPNAVQWSDMRLIPRAVSVRALEFVYRDFTENRGNTICPVI